MKKLSPLIATIVLLLSLATPALARDLFVDSGQIFPDNLFYAEHVALADRDGDGDLDAYVSHTNGWGDKIWFNDGCGVFTQAASAPLNIYNRGTGVGDLHGDGDLDVFVANDSEPNRVWLNTSRSPGGHLPVGGISGGRPSGHGAIGRRFSRCRGWQHAMRFNDDQ